MSTLVKITDLSEYAKEESLKKLVSYIGSIRHLTLKRTKSSVLECLIEFVNPDDCKLALHLNGTLFLDKELIIELYRDEDQLNRIARTIRIDQVPPDVPLDGLKALFASVEGVRRMRLGNGVDKETQLGYAYIEFTAPEFALKAMNEMQNIEFQGQQLRISPSRIAISKGKSSKQESPMVSSSAKVRTDRPEKDRESDYDRRDRSGYYDSRHDVRERRRSRAHSRDPYHRDHSYETKRRRER